MIQVIHTESMTRDTASRLGLAWLDRHEHAKAVTVLFKDAYEKACAVKVKRKDTDDDVAE